MFQIMSLSNNSINQPNFRGVEQSLNIMRQVKSYFSVGMENVLEVATDMADYSKGKILNFFNTKKLQVTLSFEQRFLHTHIFCKNI